MAGAGLAGLLSSIILRRRGYRVIVHEKEKNIGSASNYHPSLHVTPFDLSFVRELTGIDFSPSLKRMKKVLYYFGENSYSANSSAFFGIERSRRETSIDHFLFSLAEKEGVEFSFGEKNLNPLELPDGSIIATGLSEEGFERLNLPFRRVWGVAFREEVKEENYEGCAFTWFSDFTDDYAYGACFFGLRYFLLFSTLKKIEKEDVEKFRQTVWRHLGIELKEPIPTKGAVPIGSPVNPKLFHKGKILAGTISGAMEPALLFGIHGAIVSGALAGFAVDEPKRAENLFKKFTKNFWKIYLMRRYGELYPRKARQFFLHMFTRHPNLHFPIIAIMGKGIPGYRENWIKNVLKKEVNYA